MYAGAIAVPLIVGRALKLSPEQVALLISADLFCCGLVTLIQSLGFTQWFGIRLPVMMGVTFAAVGPMVAMAEAVPGVEGARTIFGSIIAAGVIGILIAPMASRMLRFFPPVVTGTHHRGDRRQPDARRHRLGDGRAAVSGQDRRPVDPRPTDRQPRLRSARQHGDRGFRARSRSC